MKKSILFFALGLVILQGKAQVDYYDYQTQAMYPSLPSTMAYLNSSSGSPLAKDGSNNVFYVHKTDNKIHYMNTTGTITDHLTNSVTVDRANGLLYQSSYLYYVSGGKVRNVHLSGSTWVEEELTNVSNPFPSVLTGTSLTIDPSGVLYFVKTDGYIEKAWKTGSGWDHAALPTTWTPNKAKANNKLYYYDYHIFYVGLDNKINNVWLNGSTWDPGVLSSTAPLAMDKTTLFSDTPGRLFYAGQDGVIYNFIWNSAWYVAPLHSGAPKVSSAIPEFTVKNDQVFYASKNGGPNNTERLFCLYWDECKWYWTDMNNEAREIKFFGPLAFDDNTLYYTGSDSKIHHYKTAINESTHDYIYVKGKKLMDHGSAFNVKGCNYLIEINNDGSGNLWAAPIGHYYVNASQPCNTLPTPPAEPICGDIATHFADIKAKGFNTVRIMGNFMVGYTPDPAHTGCTQISDANDTKIYFTHTSSSAPWSTNVEYTPTSQTKLFTLIELILDKAKDAGLKVILTTGLNNGDNVDLYSLYTAYLSDLATHFAGDETILAYDVFNEPNGICRFGDALSFKDINNNSIVKSVVCSASKDWYNAIRNASPSQLVTIGLYGNSVIGWDPTILSTDFVGFHIYPDKATNSIVYNYATSLRMWKDNMYYASSFMYDTDKPWIIEESGFLSALDNDPGNPADWGTEQDQKNFAEDLIKKTKYCGAAGYAWWQYHDVYWDGANRLTSPGQDFLGIYSNNGTVKKIISAPNPPFLTYNPAQTCDCSPSSSYYNFYAKSGSSISGTVTGVGGTPLKNALIVGQNDLEYSQTFTNDNGNGSFVLNSYNNVFSGSWYHLYVSAPGYETRVFYTYPTSPIQLVPVNCTPYNKMLMDTTVTEEDDIVSDITIVPNPTSGLVNIQVSGSDIKELTVYDIQGAVLQQYQINTKTFTIDLSGYQNQVYFLKINNGEKTVSKKIILLK